MAAAERTKRTKRCADPGKTVTRQLYGLASACAAPGCNEPLFKVVDGRRTLNSRIAHIRASSPTGPRADPYMTCAEVNDFENLVVLCLFHAIEVDDHVDEHSISMLEDWKAEQVANSQILGATFELTDEEVVEAVTAVAQSNVSTAALVDLAKAVRAMRTTAERNRANAAAVWGRRNAALASLRASMAGQMWDAETGEVVDTSGARLSGNEEQQHRDALVAALNQTHVELEPVSERVLENAAGVAAAIDCPDGLEAWLDRTLKAVLDEVMSWDIESEDPDVQVRAALAELDQVAEAFKRSAAGASVDVPPPPEPPAEPEPTPLELFVADYREFYDGLLRFTRVDQLPYDEEAHARLLETCPTLLGAPDSPHFLTQALTATQNAVLASAVCRNASDEEFTTNIVPHLESAHPEAVAALHIGYLRERYQEASNDARVVKLDDLRAALGESVLDKLDDPDFWERNHWYGRSAVNAVVAGVGEERTAAAISAAIAGNCLEGVLLAFAPVLDSMDRETNRWSQTARSYRRSGFPIFPSWFPVAELVEAARAQQGAFARDEAEELARQLLENHSRA